MITRYRYQIQFAIIIINNDRMYVVQENFFGSDSIRTSGEGYATINFKRYTCETVNFITGVFHTQRNMERINPICTVAYAGASSITVTIYMNDTGLICNQSVELIVIRFVSNAINAL